MKSILRPKHVKVSALTDVVYRTRTLLINPLGPMISLALSLRHLSASLRRPEDVKMLRVALFTEQGRC